MSYIVLLNRNCVKLADFGVAAELNENDRRYSVVGTPYWVSSSLFSPPT
jgi:serine/threonine protein kinase